jgi:hypothetical protein
MMKTRSAINYNVKDGEKFRVKAFSVNRKNRKSVTYALTTWARHLDNDYRKHLRKLSRDTRITLYQNMDTDIFGENYICVDNISENNSISHHSPLMIEITLFINEELPDVIIEKRMNHLTERLNLVYQDSEYLELSKTKHKKVTIFGLGDEIEEIEE